MQNSTTNEFDNDVHICLNPLTGYIREVVQIINCVIIAAIISVFGVGANIVNMIVFIRQGFKDSINISLLGLSISDLACSFTMVGISFFFNPLIHNLGFPIELLGVIGIVGGWPHVCATRITSFITAFITLERCLCIAMPLKVKNIITPFRTKVINVSMFLIVIAMFSPIFFVNKLEWKFSVSQNRSILGLTFTNSRDIVESVTFFIHSVFLSTVLHLSVFICTIILVVKLNKKTKWREASVAEKASKLETVSAKEKKVVKMITLIATIFFVCNIPNTAIMIAMVFIPEFNMTVKCENILYILWSIQFVLDAVNSSVNIFVYFNMSTKYRLTLNDILCGRSKSVKDTTQRTARP